MGARATNLCHQLICLCGALEAHRQVLRLGRTGQRASLSAESASAEQEHATRDRLCRDAAIAVGLGGFTGHVRAKAPVGVESVLQHPSGTPYKIPFST